MFSELHNHVLSQVVVENFLIKEISDLINGLAFVFRKGYLLVESPDIHLNIFNEVIDLFGSGALNFVRVIVAFPDLKHKPFAKRAGYVTHEVHLPLGHLGA